jgi:3-keto-5-aminohexanoate cleavage enzyme
VSWSDEPVTITVAPCGAEVTRQHNPALPHTPEEIATDAVASAAAGATIVHVHVREPDGTPSARFELFAETIERTRAGSDLITMVSTGGAVWMSMEERTQGMSAGPDLASLETGSMNFGDDLFATTLPQTRDVIARGRELGVGFEVEAFDVGHVVTAVRLLDEGDLEPPLNVNLVLGVPGGIDATPEALHAMLRPLPAGSRWSVTAIGRHQRRMLAEALLLGADGIRVGFEDNVYLRKGVLAASNAELVADAASLVQTLGRRVATPADARRSLRLPLPG